MQAYNAGEIKVDFLKKNIYLDQNDKVTIYLEVFKLKMLSCLQTIYDIDVSLKCHK